VFGNSASKKPSAMSLLGHVGLTRVSPKPATAPPPAFSSWSSTKLGCPGVSNAALAQFTPNTTGSFVPFVIDDTLLESSCGAAQPSGQPWSRCMIRKRPPL
jgi:hypothetical protein